MTDTLKYFYFKYRKFNTIYRAIKNKESVDKNLLEDLRKKHNFDNYITIIDDNYPTELNSNIKPPFVIPRKHKLILGVLVDVHTKTISPHYFVKHKDDLEDIYDMLECTCIDVQERKIGNSYFDFYIDDEGLWKENNPISVITTNKNGIIVETMVGNVFICKVNDEGSMKSLTKEEIECILNNKVQHTDCILAQI